MLTHRRDRAAPVAWPCAALLAVGWLLAACTPRPAERITVPEEAGLPPFVPPSEARIYDVDAGSSEVTVLVRRAGPLARLGHNHVVRPRQITGRAWLGQDPGRSGFDLRFPVADFVVDEPEARAGVGADFLGEVPPEAREGTYRNMLRPEVLDAAGHPQVIVRCSGLAGTWEQPVAHASVTLRAVTRELAIPLRLERGGRTLVAQGVLGIRQSDFGITPFSVVGGAIQVADEVEIRFAIRAVAR